MAPHFALSLEGDAKNEMSVPNILVLSHHDHVSCGFFSVGMGDSKAMAEEHIVGTGKSDCRLSLRARMLT